MREFLRIIFVVVPRRFGWRAVSVGEIVDDAVDLVEQTLSLFRPIGMFRHDRVLVLVEPIDDLDQPERRP